MALEMPSYNPQRVTIKLEPDRSGRSLSRIVLSGELVLGSSRQIKLGPLRLGTLSKAGGPVASALVETVRLLGDRGVGFFEIGTEPIWIEESLDLLEARSKVVVANHNSGYVCAWFDVADVDLLITVWNGDVEGWSAWPFVEFHFYPNVELSPEVVEALKDIGSKCRTGSADYFSKLCSEIWIDPTEGSRDEIWIECRDQELAQERMTAIVEIWRNSGVTVYT